MTRKRKPGKNGRSISNVDLPPALDEDVCVYGDLQPSDDDPTHGTSEFCTVAAVDHTEFPHRFLGGSVLLYP